MATRSHELNHGVYIVIVRLRRSTRLAVGALGECRFAAGWYGYVGRAGRHLQQRVARHFRADKPRRWHVDYLTTSARCRPVGAVLLPGAGETECAVNQWVGAQWALEVPASGFGASDCRGGCPAHLWYSARELSVDAVARAFGNDAAVVMNAAGR